MRNLRYRRTLLLGLMLSCAGLCQERRLGVIDFFGYDGIDLADVRSALPFHEGDVVPSAADPRDPWKAAARDAITRTVGRPPTDVETVCCTGKGDWMIYIGLPGRSTVSLEYPPVRGRPLQLPAALLSLDAELKDAWVAAVMKGSTREEDTTGYALSTDPALRSKQLDLRELALKYEHEIIDVLSHSSDSRQRAISATALGYTRQSNSQLAALVAASSDPESEVRNNAVRALGYFWSRSRSCDRRSRLMFSSICCVQDRGLTATREVFYSSSSRLAVTPGFSPRCAPKHSPPW